MGQRTLDTRIERRDDGPAALVDLFDGGVPDPDLLGAKAASLARCAALGLPVVPGIVLTTVGQTEDDLRQAWTAIGGGPEKPIAVRSSSTAEDGTTSSMAGHFVSVLDVTTWPGFTEAVAEVRRSAGTHGRMAVLVQPMLDAVCGGVLFGVDPVTGERDRLVVEAVTGNPSALVSGLARGARHVLSRRGRILEADGDGALRLGRRQCRDLAALASTTAQAFGGPQDLEWATDRSGRTWLLQSRPVTATAAAATGPRFGPGPIAETFPGPLTPLEQRLWADPLRDGLRVALQLLGAVPKRSLERSPLLIEIGGRLAVDLDLTEPPKRRGLLAKLDPRPGARRLAASWRIGRLRRALPLIAGDVISQVDRHLAELPAVSSLTDAQLHNVLERGRDTLRSLHAHEVLAGSLLPASDGGGGAALALVALAAGRAAGLTDPQIVVGHPEVLALVPPAVGRRGVLPGVPAGLPAVTTLDAREALRLRVRWVHELMARTAEELGRRGALPEAHDTPPASAPLPAVFRLTPAGEAVAQTAGADTAGRGAGGGRGVGAVGDGPGTVLVVHTLEPGLAAQLPGRAGLVAETGSVLSHLAILAREFGVPTVVGVPDAVTRFPAGTTLLVDGTTGEVEVIEL